MTPTVVAGLILLVGIVLLIALSVPIAIAIGLPTVIAAMAVMNPDVAAMSIAQRMFTGVNSFALLAIPFFILAGVLMNHGGIAGRLIDAAKVLVGRMPASMPQANIVANAMFGAVSGAAVAAASAVGTIMGPRMEKEGYSKPYTAAVNIASAPSGMLIPPSNTFIVYSLVSSTSIAALFAAGVGPGLLWVVACIVVALILYRKENVIRDEERPSLKLALVTLWRAVPSMFMIVIVIGGIIGGWFTATESSAIAVVYCLVLGFAYKNLSVRDLPGILLDSTRTTAVVMLLVAVSSGLSWVMAFARIPTLITDTLLSITDSKTGILLIIMAILLVIGTFMDPTPAILIFVPIFLPIVTNLGVDPVHFGAMVVMNLSVGVITPPVGNVLFVGSKVAGLRIEPVIAKLWPFLVGIILTLLIVVFVPQVSLWLPQVAGLM
ncbi:TRAP transporter large permease [Arcanobacterium haemolyticum]|uniref:TRAP dicarboxylate transporter, DctM subunit n=1 Tax=Arcanobacterium haemolyticum (strain ATCC 9345 / DSM 20595 / CCM 5947 / CCUG 17215 / LMG 16163 / NBRC 15585 / NCTC 8452 / 11018) TaxID=644284 RepID=D7BP82_ARCHD|nr:TRAP transporter large permease [Arcanobacterium haemolyticum]ADH92731.1 TRAP dicarboxylate transporter, DctM subunit [Arcanobacterium haemolyticum DSM 20595]SPT75150.1 Neu5Ac permease [Arcanobacterium haemolyticum]SQH28528.1 Neu5Ac permease [Arcanobacterium haemolyticum]